MLLTHQKTPVRAGDNYENKEKLTPVIVGTQNQSSQANLSLIEVKDNKVSSIGLHEFLDVKTRHDKWITKIIQDYDFTAGKDFCPKMSESTGGRPSVDYLLSIHAAKEICMVSKTKTAKDARKYFISCEEKLKSVDQFKELTILDILKLNQKAIEDLENKVIELKPKAEHYDAVMSADKWLTIEEVAKLIGKTGRNKLFELLREKGMLRYNNTPYQQYVARGLFKLRETQKTDKYGNIRVHLQPLVSQRGLDFIRRSLLGVQFLQTQNVNEAYV